MIPETIKQKLPNKNYQTKATKQKIVNKKILSP